MSRSIVFESSWLKGFVFICNQPLVEKIGMIDFPTRLDKLDSTVGSINQGLQNTQQRLGDLERNLKDDLQSKAKDILIKVEHSERDLKEQLGTIHKENGRLKTLLLVSLALSIASIVILFIRL